MTRRKFFAAAAGGIAAALPGAARAEAETAMPQYLEIRLELKAVNPPAGAVILHNGGAPDIHIWRLGTSWGDPTLSFELITGGQVREIRLKPQVYTMNGPLSIPLLAGQDFKIGFDLGDGRWTPDLQAEPPAAGSRLVAVYRGARLPETDQYAVWTGTIRSAPVKLD